jgi:hypothetical protein
MSGRGKIKRRKSRLQRSNTGNLHTPNSASPAYPSRSAKAKKSEMSVEDIEILKLAKKGLTPESSGLEDGKAKEDEPPQGHDITDVTDPDFPNPGGRDPYSVNSMHWKTATVIFVFVLFATDFFYAYVDRRCYSEQSKMYLEDWKIQTTLSKHVESSCERIDYWFGGLWLPVEGICRWIHPVTQKEFYARARADNHYELAESCAGEYLGEMAIGFGIAAFTISMLNPHTRRMIPWIIRNPLGFEAI